MNATVSTFQWVGREPYRHTFLLVVRDAFEDAVRDEISRQAEAFGAALGPAGQFVKSQPQRMYETAEEVMAKAWPDDVRDRMYEDADPFLLALADPFADFDPREHPYAIVWLSDFHEHP